MTKKVKSRNTQFKNNFFGLRAGADTGEMIRDLRALEKFETIESDSAMIRYALKRLHREEVLNKREITA